jgi:Spy/CpxP family protein refolding chaperone
MGKENTGAAKAEAKATEAKRTMLTPEQRVAKLEAELAEARKKAEAKANKAKTEAAEKRAKIRDKMVELNTQHNDLTEVVGDKAFSNVTIDGAAEKIHAV